MSEELREIERLMAAMEKNGASDLHLKAGSRPMMRVAGKPRAVGQKVLLPAMIEDLIRSILSDVQMEKLKKNGDLDLAHSVSGVGRFRINVFRQRGAFSVAIRRVNVKIPSTEELHLPEAVLKFAKLERGLCLVTGITGSGKSTTLASLIEYINQNRHCHILTIEDPIEYLYRDKKSFINQREVGIDVENFGVALRVAVRQDPDVILCGEMRDNETVEFALNAAETGHLVFGTLHSSNAAQSISRVLDFFTPADEDHIRKALSFNLRGIISQRLLPSISQAFDRVPCIEIMFNTPTIQKLIRDKDDQKIPSAIRAANSEQMQDFNQSLVELVNNKFISKATALQYSDNAEQLEMNLKGIFLGADRGIIS